MQEEWRDVKGWPYKISRSGQVARCLTPAGKPCHRPLTHRVKPPGYLRVALCRNGQILQTGVHKILMEAFGPPRPFPGAMVRHLDGNAANNDLGNLAWGNASDNQNDRRVSGTDCGGERHYLARLSNDQARQLRADYRQLLGSKKKLPNGSGAALAKRYGIHRATMTKIIAGSSYSLA